MVLLCLESIGNGLLRKLLLRPKFQANVYTIVRIVYASMVYSSTCDTFEMSFPVL